MIDKEGMSTAVGDEGGFAPNLALPTKRRIQWLLKAIEERRGLEPAGRSR